MMPFDRSCIDRRVAGNGRTITEEFREGVKEFLNFAYSIPGNKKLSVLARLVN